MDIKNRRAVRYAASHALADNPGNPRMVVLIYTLIISVSALAVSALLTVLDNRIAGTGGLGNLGLRSILSTIRTILPLAHTIVLWGIQLGYQKATVRMARRQAAAPRNLVEGFSWFGPMLRSVLLKGALFFLLAMVAGYAASAIFLVTPLSNDFVSLITPLMTDSEALYNALYSDPVFYGQAFSALLPMMPIFLVLFLAAAAPFFYAYRMTNYCILETRGKGALAALQESARMMKGRRLDLLKLDLGFWWFWLAQLLASVVLYGDVILEALDVALPWSATVSYYVFYVLSLAMEGVLYYFCLNRVETTYATVYDELRPRPQSSHGGAVLGNIFDLAKDYRED